MHDDGRPIHSRGMGPDDGEAPRQVDDRETPEGDREASGGSPLGKEGGFVYFIETEDGQFMKIGYSRDVYRRMSRLGTLRPSGFQLRILGWIPGSIQTERWLHKKFEKDRDNGEWFRSTSKIREFLAMLGPILPEPPEEPKVIAPKSETPVKRNAPLRSLAPGAIPPSMMCKCQRCGYEWVRRTAGRPKRCPGPKCKSPYWDSVAGELPMGRPKKKAGKKRKVSK